MRPEARKQKNTGRSAWPGAREPLSITDADHPPPETGRIAKNQ